MRRAKLKKRLNIQVTGKFKKRIDFTVVSDFNYLYASRQHNPSISSRYKIKLTHLGIKYAKAVFISSKDKEMRHATLVRLAPDFPKCRCTQGSDASTFSYD